MVQKHIDKSYFNDVNRKNFRFPFAVSRSPRHAFTLAEVLITLGVIGIVAAMTIPTIISKMEEKATISRLKKVYSELSNAFTLAVEENGTPDNWGLMGLNNTTGYANFNAIMSKQLKVSKNCGLGPGCFAPGNYRDLNGIDYLDLNTGTHGSKLLLADGTSIFLRQWSATCTFGSPAGWGNTVPLKSVCGEIEVDTNGFKGPNQYGVDHFGFILTKVGIIPLGTASQASSSYANYCNKTKSSIVAWPNGHSCTAWVLENENMDYLDCNDLSWTGKKKCD